MKTFPCLVAIALVLGSVGNCLFAQQDQAETDQKVQDGIRAMMLTSKAFRDASEKVKPWIVTIESFGGVVEFMFSVQNQRDTSSNVLPLNLIDLRSGRASEETWHFWVS